jgi:hypothetical protein
MVGRKPPSPYQAPLRRLNRPGCAGSNLRPKRLPDGPEPWASGVRQANLLHLLPQKIMCNGFINCFENRP